MNNINNNDAKNDDLLTPRRSFYNYSEYEQFCQAIEFDENFETIEGSTDITMVGLREQLYHHLPTDTIWRLVKVDFPCRGSWEQIEL